MQRLTPHRRGQACKGSLPTGEGRHAKAHSPPERAGMQRLTPHRRGQACKGSLPTGEGRHAEAHSPPKGTSEPGAFSGTGLLPCATQRPSIRQTCEFRQSASVCGAHAKQTPSGPQEVSRHPGDSLPPQAVSRATTRAGRDRPTAGSEDRTHSVRGRYGSTTSGATQSR
jgi:hypothetical protein